MSQKKQNVKHFFSVKFKIPNRKFYRESATKRLVAKTLKKTVERKGLFKFSLLYCPLIIRMNKLCKMENGFFSSKVKINWAY